MYFGIRVLFATPLIVGAAVLGRLQATTFAAERGMSQDMQDYLPAIGAVVAGVFGLLIALALFGLLRLALAGFGD